MTTVAPLPIHTSSHPPPPAGEPSPPRRLSSTNVGSPGFTSSFSNLGAPQHPFVNTVSPRSSRQNLPASVEEGFGGGGRRRSSSSFRRRGSLHQQNQQQDLGRSACSLTLLGSLVDRSGSDDTAPCQTHDRDRTDDGHEQERARPSPGFGFGAIRMVPLTDDAIVLPYLDRPREIKDAFFSDTSSPAAASLISTLHPSLGCCLFETLKWLMTDVGRDQLSDDAWLAMIRDIVRDKGECLWVSLAGAIGAPVGWGQADVTPPTRRRTVRKGAGGGEGEGGGGNGEALARADQQQRRRESDEQVRDADLRAAEASVEEAVRDSAADRSVLYADDVETESESEVEDTAIFFTPVERDRYHHGPRRRSEENETHHHHLIKEPGSYKTLAELVPPQVRIIAQEGNGEGVDDGGGERDRLGLSSVPEHDVTVSPPARSRDNTSVSANSLRPSVNNFELFSSLSGTSPDATRDAPKPSDPVTTAAPEEGVENAPFQMDEQPASPDDVAKNFKTDERYVGLRLHTSSVKMSGPGPGPGLGSGQLAVSPRSPASVSPSTTTAGASAGKETMSDWKPCRLYHLLGSPDVVPSHPHAPPPRSSSGGDDDRNVGDASFVEQRRRRSFSSGCGGGGGCGTNIGIHGRSFVVGKSGGHVGWADDPSPVFSSSSSPWPGAFASVGGGGEGGGGGDSGGGGGGGVHARHASHGSLSPSLGSIAEHMAEEGGAAIVPPGGPSPGASPFRRKSGSASQLSSASAAFAFSPARPDDGGSRPAGPPPASGSPSGSGALGLNMGGGGEGSRERRPGFARSFSDHASRPREYKTAGSRVDSTSAGGGVAHQAAAGGGIAYQPPPPPSSAPPTRPFFAPWSASFAPRQPSPPSPPSPTGQTRSPTGSLPGLQFEAARLGAAPSFAAHPWDRHHRLGSWKGAGAALATPADGTSLRTVPLRMSTSEGAQHDDVLSPPGVPIPRNAAADEEVRGGRRRASFVLGGGRSLGSAQIGGPFGGGGGVGGSSATKDGAEMGSLREQRPSSAAAGAVAVAIGEARSADARVSSAPAATSTPGLMPSSSASTVSSLGERYPDLLDEPMTPGKPAISQLPHDILLPVPLSDSRPQELKAILEHPANEGALRAARAACGEQEWEEARRWLEEKERSEWDDQALLERVATKFSLDPSSAFAPSPTVVHTAPLDPTFSAPSKLPSESPLTAPATSSPTRRRISSAGSDEESRAYARWVAFDKVCDVLGVEKTWVERLGKRVGMV